MVFEITILLYIALILLAAKIFGEVAERLGVSALIGEVLAGLLFGPLLGIIKPNAFLEQIATLGVLFLLFIIGLNTRFDDVKKDAYKGSVLALVAAALSFIAGTSVGFAAFNDINAAIFLGVALLSTSTPITLRALANVGEIKTRVYEISLSIDMADKVIAILALSLLTTYSAYGTVQIWTVAALFFVVLGFFVVITTIGARAVSNFLSFFRMMVDEQMLVAIPLVIVFVVAFLSEQVGIAGVTGAFLAGMAMSKSQLTENIILPKTKIIGHGFFIPIFFAYSAVLFDLNALYSGWHVIVLLVVFGSLAKLIGAGYMGRFYKLGTREQLLIGIGMIPRGEFAIVISQIALAAGIVTSSIYTIAVASVIVTIIITPILMKLASGKKGF